MSWGSTTSRAAAGAGSTTTRSCACSPSPSCSTCGSGEKSPVAGTEAGPLQGSQDALLGVERLVGDQRVRGELGQQDIGSFEVLRLPRREREPGRVAERVHERVDLRAQAAPAAPDRLVAPAAFLGAPALCWWARTTVLSIMAYSLSASLARCLKTLSQTPALAQRQKRVWTFFQAPNRSGRSRQGMPAR